MRSELLAALLIFLILGLSDAQKPNIMSFPSFLAPLPESCDITMMSLALFETSVGSGILMRIC